MVTREAVLEALRAITDPDVQKDIVALGLVRDLEIADSKVSLTLAYTTQSPATKVSMHSTASRLIGQLPGVTGVQVRMGGGQVAKPAAPAAAPRPAHFFAALWFGAVSRARCHASAASPQWPLFSAACAAPRCSSYSP
ncbi:MAG: iron-sulfur cluster assembly protein, partial [Dehalococcoidia bacterium]|nr:iron-sulfur cluster assembly protein [Dehalococcoidia bacterium]